MNYKVFLSLGSNIEDREKYLLDAIDNISAVSGVSLEKISNIYETEPVGYTEQGRFLNMAAQISTSLEAEELLDKLLEIEKLLKRERIIHWGPRTIDIDILTYGDLRIDTPKLKVPHPRMFERAFVLIPLMDICEKERLYGININDALDKCGDKDGVRLYKKMTVCDLPGGC
ncbi:MAG TPA: 2-amino-4-hydroxy-6-hydroxymethyldihydropteridine diphosphokinase [Hungateiclostridium thermocellum]|jgi:2-amino-4-hydroxy-6-hydroxymethyldihydropteridine diphosphokinase|uniref:2-amino-4-hydroxy-6-hydroxymethyldihydropteridine diphosphokinase n=2 Tax=Acetivibrio thermocellus TaxID=1515 RepID=A3DIK4_ACET2|nr:2-amino-4-hydroxy-6-hydroxymethyldihydropteridine diphosphokinase [Acetivibrio thermocellus]CDG37046.1 2-amino-4-hydroxy-6-hydroxymethyldihydropteridinepyrophosphokinase [Acetivibrio thermocellus BC1]ABN53783.1 2-amino-4-hydroxy-6-hydroxymethyldihydropteridine pyrophosphokinase [Acetivibrio thermocellus ATCC 27405]ADU73265.1 2-amino-4-hydroxy-6-hydroxymethyldihydropteridine pyrophosphokinase [Acetivibrio thermocellus DSM 1313]ALX07183.1 2-amino-4-hydroxy-6-hydroxymethyldihydropteridine pyrop